jgi:hypothetical protein
MVVEPTPAAPAVAAPAVAAPVVAKPSPPAEPASVAPPPAVGNAPAASVQVDAARAALEQKLNELDKSPARPARAPTTAPIAAPIIVVSPNPAKTGVMSPTNLINANIPTKELGLKAIEPPLVPVSASQEAQLLDLLAKYKANQISPQEYHKQRAEILAQQ